jgi:hypothetical protein
VSILLDAGPSLNFLAVGQENILIQAAASQKLQLAAPARVDAEISGMARSARFARTRAGSTWATLKTSHRVEILPDELTTQEFTDAVTRISGMQAQNRVRDKKSLGEIMVLAHASVYVQQGVSVFVLIDEGDGRKRAGREARWLRDEGCTSVLTLWSTRQILQDAGRHTGWIKSDKTWEQVYDAMTAFDEGLRPRSEWQKRP